MLIQNIHKINSDNLARARLARKLNPRKYELQAENKLYLLKKAARRESKGFFKSRSPLMKQYRQIMKNRQIKQRIKQGIAPKKNRAMLASFDQLKNANKVQSVERTLESVSADPRMAAVSEEIKKVAITMSQEKIQKSNVKVAQTINEFKKQLLQSKNPMALLRAAFLFAIEKYNKLIAQTPTIQHGNVLSANEKILKNNLQSINAKLKKRMDYKMYLYITMYFIVMIFLLVARVKSATNFGLGLELPT